MKCYRHDGWYDWFLIIYAAKLRKKAEESIFNKFFFVTFVSKDGSFVATGHNEEFFLFFGTPFFGHAYGK